MWYTCSNPMHQHLRETSGSGNKVIQWHQRTGTLQHWKYAPVLVQYYKTAPTALMKIVQSSLTPEMLAFQSPSTYIFLVRSNSAQIMAVIWGLGDIASASLWTQGINHSHGLHFIYCRWLLLMIHINFGICLTILLRQAISADWYCTLSLSTRPPQFSSAESSMSKPWVLFWFGTKHVLGELCPAEAPSGFMVCVQLPATLKNGKSAYKWLHYWEC